MNIVHCNVLYQEHYVSRNYVEKLINVCQLDEINKIAKHLLIINEYIGR